MLPVHPSSSAPAVIPYHLLLILSDGRVLMRRRKERLLQGLWCFPMLEAQKTPSVNDSSVKQCLNICVSDIQEAGNARHVFTHRIWQMKIYSMSAAPGQKEPSGYSFIPVDKLKELAIPTAMHAALSVLSQKTAGEKLSGTV